MRRSRRHIVIALVVIGLHLGSALVSAVGLCCTSMPVAQAAMGEDVCCQGLAPGQMCPMHKHRGGGDRKGAPSQPGPATMRDACAPLDTSLPSLSFGLGLVTPHATLGHELDSAPAPLVDIDTLRTRSLLPDLPPPRA